MRGRGRPNEVFSFQDDDAIVTVIIQRTARPRSETGRRPNRVTPQANALSAIIREFVSGTAAHELYRLPKIELPTSVADSATQALGGW
jgi:hypothetical protein